jgi:hypothetical protein
MSDSEISGGFFNRWGMFSTKATRLIPFPVSPDREKWRAITRDLVEVVHDSEGERPLTLEARDLFAEFYGLVRKRNEPGLRGEATARADLHAIKYSLLYAILEHHQQIEAEDIARGIALATYNLEVALSVVGDAALSWSGAREKKLMALLRNGRISMREAMRTLRLSADELNHVARALERVGAIDIRPETTSSGHRRVFLELV